MQHHDGSIDHRKTSCGVAQYRDVWVLTTAGPLTAHTQIIGHANRHFERTGTSLRDACSETKPTPTHLSALFCNHNTN